MIYGLTILTLWTAWLQWDNLQLKQRLAKQEDRHLRLLNTVSKLSNNTSVVIGSVKDITEILKVMAEKNHDLALRTGKANGH